MPHVAKTTIRSIVHVILPAYPALDAPTRSAVEADVAGYVAGQVSAMPGFLRLPYLLALVAFETVPVLRYGRPFRWLPGAAAAACLAWWDGAPIGAMRDVVKVIRSTALLAYFDHPAVTARLEAERSGAAALSAPRAANE